MQIENQGHRNTFSGGRILRYVAGGVAGVVALSALMGSYFTVPPGSVGIMTRFNAIQDTVYGEGPHLKAPFVEDVNEVGVQPRAWKSESVDSGTKDLQTVTTGVTVNVSVDPVKAKEFFREYRTIDNMAERVLDPSVKETIKATTAKFTAEQLITQRAQVRDEIIAQLRIKLKPGFVLVNDVSITNFEFSKSFAEAVEKKVTAEQQALQAENDLKRITIQGEQTVATAKAQAEAIRIQSEAVEKQGGKGYVQLQAIAKWDGHLPKVTSSGAGQILDLKEIESDSK